MTTITWVIIIYLFTVLVSQPYIRKYVTKNPLEQHIFNQEFVIWFASSIPILNILLVFEYLKGVRVEKKFEKAKKSGVFGKSADIVQSLITDDMSEEDKETYTRLAETLRRIEDEKTKLDDIKTD